MIDPTGAAPLTEARPDALGPTMEHRPAPQDFTLADDRLTRHVRIGERVVDSWVPVVSNGVPPPGSDDLLRQWWTAYLLDRAPRPVAAAGRPLRMADLFCGAGGLALGARQLAREMGRHPVFGFAVDTDADALATFASNHDVRVRDSRSVTALVDYRVRGRADSASFAYPPELLDPEISGASAELDLVMAGPPCQGHSSLNNRTRWSDPRNPLMIGVAAFAVATRVPAVIIENVPGAVRDSDSVVATVRALLRSDGYGITDGVLTADEMGWPQTRRRFFLVARRDVDPLPLRDVAAAVADPDPSGARASVSWILTHLDSTAGAGSGDPLAIPTDHSPENAARIDWLFEHKKYDLPDSERPDCHRDGTTYGSVYGRMHSDRPAPTITTGFTSPGRGRFIHPTERRTITPREAAVIQAFPLAYRFVTEAGGTPSRSQLAKWIGDAVPMPLGYAAALSALG